MGKIMPASEIIREMVESTIAINQRNSAMFKAVSSYNMLAYSFPLFNCRHAPKNLNRRGLYICLIGKNIFYTQFLYFIM